MLCVQERRKITVSCGRAACRKRRQNNPQLVERVLARLDSYHPWSRVCRYTNFEWGNNSYDVAGELGIDHKTVLAHLKKVGYTKKLDIWVPHELTERNLMNRVPICDSLLRRNETEPFLKKLITGDEKWITYDKNV
ncbi:hypothetical protein K1T71_003770 [Dendrolimus kikuchii]|uniref:Uncharacterized protein n=1 Tax=Dendrolimus kikuchii TaxID=765133 RepID=A0ACC1D958_9NEOP|nr:hypothetical protein K1T71_003770 [Dendrolimus kikuchii]